MSGGEAGRFGLFVAGPDRPGLDDRGGRICRPAFFGAGPQGRRRSGPDAADAVFGLLEESGAFLHLHAHARPLHTVAVAREADVAFGFDFLDRLAVGQAVALQAGIALAQFDAAFSDEFDIGLAGDPVGSNEGRQRFAGLLEPWHDARRRLQFRSGQFACRDVGRVERRQRAFGHLRRFLRLLDGFRCRQLRRGRGCGRLRGRCGTCRGACRRRRCGFRRRRTGGGGGPRYGCGCGPRLFGGQIAACCRRRLHHARGGCNRLGDGGGLDNGGHRRCTRAEQGGIHAQRWQRFGHGGTRSQRQQGEQ
jgi:hypothetical protein